MSAVLPLSFRSGRMLFLLADETVVIVKRSYVRARFLLFALSVRNDLLGRFLLGPRLQYAIAPVRLRSR
jgi:hypothetical protein